MTNTRKETHSPVCISLHLRNTLFQQGVIHCLNVEKSDFIYCVLSFWQGKMQHIVIGGGERRGHFCKKTGSLQENCTGRKGYVLPFFPNCIIRLEIWLEIALSTLANGKQKLLPLTERRRTDSRKI